MSLSTYWRTWVYAKQNRQDFDRFRPTSAQRRRLDKKRRAGK